MGDDTRWEMKLVGLECYKWGEGKRSVWCCASDVKCLHSYKLQTFQNKTERRCQEVFTSNACRELFFPVEIAIRRRNKKLTKLDRKAQTSAIAGASISTFTNGTYWQHCESLSSHLELRTYISFCWLSKDIIGVHVIFFPFRARLASLSVSCCIAKWQPSMIKRKNV